MRSIKGLKKTKLPGQEEARALPQLSDVERGQSFSFQQTRDGLFVPLDVMNDLKDGESTPLEKLNYLDLIIKSLPGKTDNRESIPDVMSQYLAYRITLGNDPMGDNSREIISRWRGAVALMLLYPFYAPLHWRGIGYEAANAFILNIGAVLNERPESGWQTLCAVYDGKYYPVVGFDEQVYAVPAASDDGLHLMHVPFSRVEDGRRVLCDPIPFLSTFLLAALKEGLMALPFTQTSRTARDIFIADIDKQLFSLKKRDREAEREVLTALLLRDVSPVDIYVAAKPQMTFEHMNEPAAVAQMLYGHSQYAVRLNGQIIGFLDDERLLWLLDPIGFTLGPVMKTLAEQNRAAMKAGGVLDIFRFKASQLQKAFPAAPFADIMPVLAGRMEAQWHPKARPEDQADLPERFTLLDASLSLPDDPAALFPGAPLYLLDGAREAQNGKELLQGMRRVYRDGLKPLGAYGAKAYAVLSSRGITPEIAFYQADDSAVDVVFAFDPSPRDMPLKLLSVRRFMPYEAKPGREEWLPAVTLWPGYEDAPDEQARHDKWEDYYVHTCFEPFDGGQYMDARVYGPDGKPCAEETAQCGRPESGGRSLNWHTARSLGKPLFTLLSHQGDAFGAVVFDRPLSRFPKASEDQFDLAVDFGMTGSLGAYARRTPRRTTLKDIVYPMMPKDALFYGTNALVGERTGADFFIPPAEQMDAENGVVFTALKRFMAGDPERNAALLDGHIHFPGDTPFMPDQTPDSVRTGFKLLEGGPGSMRPSEDVKLFLTQLVKMYFFCLRREGARKVSVRFASPLALRKEQRGDMRRLFAEITEEAARGTGLESVTVQMTSESMAVGAYFAHLPDPEITVRPSQGILTLDIGGGTADYSLWTCREADGEEEITAKRCASNLLAGHQLVAGYLDETRGGDSALKWFSESLRLTDAAERSRMVRHMVRQLQTGAFTSYPALAAGMDQLLRWDMGAFKEVLSRDTRECRMYLSVMTFEMALLFFIAWQIYLKETRSRTRETTLCLAGNGALLYHDLFDEQRKELVCQVASGDLTRRRLLTTPRLRHFKCEVAKGLLIDERIFDQSAPDETDIETRSMDGDALWRAFEQFLRLYGQAFTGAYPKDELARYIQSLTAQKPLALKQMEGMFKERINDLDSLNAQLLYIRDMITHRPFTT